MDLVGIASFLIGGKPFECRRYVAETRCTGRELMFIYQSEVITYNLPVLLKRENVFYRG
jgi:hypothetical protein